MRPYRRRHFFPSGHNHAAPARRSNPHANLAVSASPPRHQTHSRAAGSPAPHHTAGPVRKPSTQHNRIRIQHIHNRRQPLAIRSISRCNACWASTSPASAACTISAPRKFPAARPREIPLQPRPRNPGLQTSMLPAITKRPRHFHRPSSTAAACAPTHLPAHSARCARVPRNTRLRRIRSRRSPRTPPRIPSPRHRSPR